MTTAAAENDTEDRAEQAEASSAHARINIPLNLENWKSLAADVQDELMWFHQYILDDGMNWAQTCEALGYNRSTVFRVLKGTYEGSWSNVKDRILSFRRILSERSSIQKTEFRENSVSRLIWGGLDYAMANNSITLISGESGMGKSIASLQWKKDNNHGRTVYVIAPALGGTKALLRVIAAATGNNKNQNLSQSHEAVMRAFNRNRMLLLDEAHRLLPTDRRSNPVNVEVLRDIHDRTGCAMGFISTARFGDQLLKSDYQFEQLLGRIGMSVRIPRRLKHEDFLPILKQYVRSPSPRLIATADQIVNSSLSDKHEVTAVADLGRMRVLAEILKVGSRIAAKDKNARGTMIEEHVFKAIALRRQMMGETKFAA